MRVYELIQELVQHDADAEVKFRVKADFDTNVVADFDRSNENDEQDVTVYVEFDEDVDFVEISNTTMFGQPKEVTISLEY